MNKKEEKELFETWLIGSALAGAPFHEILMQIDVKDFTQEQNKNIYMGLCNLYSQSKPINIANCIAANICVEPFLHMKPGIADMTDWQMYINKIKEASLHRMLEQKTTEALKKLNQGEDANAVKEGLILALNSLESEKRIIPFEQDIEAWLKDLKANPTFEPVLFSGLPSLNLQISPLVGARLIFLAARPSQGKTALAVQMALEMASNGNPVGFFSLENCKPQLFEVLTASAFKINRTRLANKDMSEFETIKNENTYNKFINSDMYVFDDKFKLDDICSTITYLVKAKGIKVAIIDYIGLIQAKRNRNESTNDYLGSISRRLKVLTMHLKIPIIVLCQLNRESDKENRKPVLADLRSCGNFEQDADCVLMLHRDKETKFADAQEIGLKHIFYTSIYIEKSRVGPVTLAGKYYFNGTTQRFSELLDFKDSIFIFDERRKCLGF